MSGVNLKTTNPKPRESACLLLTLRRELEGRGGREVFGSARECGSVVGSRGRGAREDHVTLCCSLYSRSSHTSECVLLVDFRTLGGWREGGKGGLGVFFRAPANW